MQGLKLIGGGYFSENFDFAKELEFAFATVEQFLRGVKLTNLEKIEIRKKLEFVFEDDMKTPKSSNSKSSPGRDVAVWFLRENYDYDPVGLEQERFVNAVRRDLAQHGRMSKMNLERHFQKRQDDTHKP